MIEVCRNARDRNAGIPTYGQSPRAVRNTAAPIRIDVIEKGDTYVVRAEIPGVSKEAIEVTIEGNAVTIAAAARSEAEVTEGERVLRSERHVGAMARSFTLPVELDEAASHAKYEAGVLELTLTKKLPVAGRKLTIQ